MDKSRISKSLFIILNIFLYMGIIGLFFLPKLYDAIAILGMKNFSEQSLLYQVALYTCAIISLLIIYILIRIMKDVYLESPFKRDTEINLKKIAVLFMLLSFIVFVKTIFLPTILSIGVVLGTFIVSLNFYVLSQIFKVAIEYKHDVDHTI